MAAIFALLPEDIQLIIPFTKPSTPSKQQMERVFNEMLNHMEQGTLPFLADERGIFCDYCDHFCNIDTIQETVYGETFHICSQYCLAEVKNEMKRIHNIV